MAKTSPTPQVPGEPPTPPAADPAPGAPAASPVAADGTVSIARDDLDALHAELAALRAAKAAPVTAPKRQADPSESLPDQSSVDADTIKAPVLTRQGWVVPTEFGTPPAAKR